MTAGLDAEGRPSEDDRRHVVGQMQVRVAHARAVEQQAVVQERPLAVGCIAQARQEVAVQLQVVRIELGLLLELLQLVLMMREAMVLLGHADLRERPDAELAPHHEGGNAREIRLQGQDVEVEHQRGVVAELGRNADWLLNRR